MKLIGAVHKFNTGRPYAEDRQPITWAIVQHPEGKTVVAFIDHARHIEGVIDLHVSNHDLITDSWVLRAYDDYHYHLGFHECRFLWTLVS